MSGQLPDELVYLDAMAMAVGPAWRYWAQHARIERHARVWRELALVHEQICQREDGPALMRWLSLEMESGVATDRQQQVLGLVRLLGSLGRAGVCPFDRPVLSLAPKAKLPKTNSPGDAKNPPSPRAEGQELPVSLQRRLKQARALGIMPGWHCLAEFVDRVDEVKFNRLCTMVHRMRTLGQDRALRSLLVDRRITSRKTAAMARSLLHVVDALEIF